MARYFNKRIKYRKKNFNIYSKIFEKKAKNIHIEKKNKLKLDKKDTILRQYLDPSIVPIRNLINNILRGY